MNESTGHWRIRQIYKLMNQLVTNESEKCTKEWLKQSLTIRQIYEWINEPVTNEWDKSTNERINPSLTNPTNLEMNKSTSR